ncbi:MAG: hypothetical protein J6X12_01800 [Paludibacteraceae bacterium]|nr:hypothetical protein [Paludibacteraceae bacterium]
MKNKILALVVLPALCLPMFAGINMFIKQKDGKFFQFDVAELDTLVFFNAVRPSDSTAHMFVDLGLPSGTLWATCNVGGENYILGGDFFAWGETEAKESYYTNNYKWYDEDSEYTPSNQMSKYNLIDGLKKLLPEDDAATVNWGTDWEMPTIEQFHELCQYCTISRYTPHYGVMFTGPNGNSIFLPSKGYMFGSYNYNDNGEISYWSSSLNSATESAFYAGMLYGQTTKETAPINYSRYTGHNVRPVLVKKSTDFTSADTNVIFNNTLSVKQKDGYIESFLTDDVEEIFFSERTAADTFVDLDLPSGTLWAKFNLGANRPEEFGDLYAWGETETKPTYSWYSYFDSDDGGSTFYKYYYAGGMIELDDEDDAAWNVWGPKWRMPTSEELSELIDNCYWEWTKSYKNTNICGYIVYKARTDYDKGYIVDTTSEKRPGYNVDEDKHLFLPSAGFGFFGEWNSKNEKGYYWTRSLSSSYEGRKLSFSSYSIYNDPVINRGRCNGYSVRPVYTEKSSNVAPVVIDTAADTINVLTPSDTSYVDLALPSGNLWASCNIGATTPEGRGNYFAWGETEPKKVSVNEYKWENDKYGIIKYNTADSLTTLLPEDDAATVIWGDDWRIPTVEDFNELIENCEISREEINGVAGTKFTAENGNWIFLPFAGYLDKKIKTNREPFFDGYYWTSSLESYALPYSFLSYQHNDYPIEAKITHHRCRFGLTIRPVKVNK